jgi:hypothetical protein
MLCVSMTAVKAGPIGLKLAAFNIEGYVHGPIPIVADFFIKLLICFALTCIGVEKFDSFCIEPIYDRKYNSFGIQFLSRAPCSVHESIVKITNAALAHR